jgi:hypothetical protein
MGYSIAEQMKENGKRGGVYNIELRVLHYSILLNTFAAQSCLSAKDYHVNIPLLREVF